MNAENQQGLRAQDQSRQLGIGCSPWWLLLPGVALAGMIFQKNYRPFEGKRTDSRVMGNELADAVTQYFGDYNRLPQAASTKEGQDTETDSSSAEGLIRILIGKEGDADRIQNPRKINYLEGMKNAKARTSANSRPAGSAQGSDKWVGGVVIEVANLEMVDGWGGYYRIRMDSNGDGEMENPDPNEVADGRLKLANRVIVWSAGKDGKWETWDDNPKTWD